MRFDKIVKSMSDGELSALKRETHNVLSERALVKFQNNDYEPLTDEELTCIEEGTPLFQVITMYCRRTKSTHALGKLVVEDQ